MCFMAKWMNFDGRKLHGAPYFVVMVKKTAKNFVRIARELIFGVGSLGHLTSPMMGRVEICNSSSLMSPMVLNMNLKINVILL